MFSTYKAENINSEDYKYQRNKTMDEEEYRKYEKYENKQNVTVAKYTNSNISKLNLKHFHHIQESL